MRCVPLQAPNILDSLDTVQVIKEVNDKDVDPDVHQTTMDTSAAFLFKNRLQLCDRKIGIDAILIPRNQPYTTCLGLRVTPATAVRKLEARLPVEIWSHVFKILVEDTFRGWDATCGTFSYNWVCILRVCKAWRSIALSTPRLFRYIDFTRIPLSAIQTWVVSCKMVTLYVWLPDSDTIVLQAALRKRPELPSLVSRLSLQRELPNSAWCCWDDMTSLQELCLRDESWDGRPYCYPLPLVSGLSGLRRLHISGNVPYSAWSEAVFPATLQHLNIDLDPFEHDMDPFELLLAGTLRAALARLHLLQYLSISTTLLQYDGPQDPLDLPHLRSVSLRMTETDYPTIAALLPPRPLHNYSIDIGPYLSCESADQDTSIMVDSMIQMLEGRRGIYCTVTFKITLDDVFMSLHGKDGHDVCIRVIEEYGRYLCQILCAVDGSTITRIIIDEEAFEGALTEEEMFRCNGVLDALRILSNVDEVILQSEFGRVSRDLLAGLTRAPPHDSFPTHSNVAESWGAPRPGAGYGPVLHGAHYCSVTMHGLVLLEPSKTGRGMRIVGIATTVVDGAVFHMCSVLGPVIVWQGV